ncbi:predicted protein [Methanosarcina acetivorans C2A]|uniref:Uncharacterized protein n=1 Tax=Methanosarcina acetivorans (strain ATCC 35395 / DSM 2834 / JCM 12185 / C2A) TaxID=188937 RepID=Q8TJH7_METAC|nr:predicted protein [Methanosarcina acetivorans C2A]
MGDDICDGKFFASAPDPFDPTSFSLAVIGSKMNFANSIKGTMSMSSRNQSFVISGEDFLQIIETTSAMSSTISGSIPCVSSSALFPHYFRTLRKCAVTRGETFETSTSFPPILAVRFGGSKTSKSFRMSSVMPGPPARPRS